jgi:tetratricopeptide (TPR) repeat protein
MSATALPPLDRRQRILVALLLAASVTVNAFCLPALSPTYDEPMHYRYGANVLALDANRIDNSKMPVSALNALPARLGLAPDPFSDTPGRQARGLLAARLVTLICWTLASLVVFAWARELYGTSAGFLALLLTLLEPNLMAHAQLVTTDAYATGLVLLATYLFWKFQRRGGWGWATAAAAALGIAQLGKYTAVFLYPLFLLLAIVRGLRPLLEARRAGSAPPVGPIARRFALWVGFFTVVSVAVIDAGFLFHRMFVPLGDYAFRTEGFRDLQRLPLLGRLRVPLPYPFLEGLDWVKYTELTGEDVGRPYLHGRIYSQAGGGIPGYFLLAVLYKVPLALQLIVAIALVRLLLRREGSFLDREWFLVAPALFFTIYLNFFFRYAAGIRYLLVAFPFFLITAGSLAQAWHAWGPRARAGLAALVLWQAASVASWFPWYIPYFNELTWNRTFAYRKLADSNLDWGQADGALERYRAQHPEVIANPMGPVPGRIVVAANLFTGVLLPERMAWLRDHYAPIGHVAYANLIFDVTERSLRELGLLEADPVAQAGRYLEVGVALLRAREWDHAEQVFTTATRLDPGCADAWAKLGVAYHQQEKLEQAERCYRKAIELAPDHLHAHRNLAFLYREQGRSAEALVVLKRALALAPGDPELAAQLTEAQVETSRGGATGASVRGAGARDR